MKKFLIPTALMLLLTGCGSSVNTHSSAGANVYDTYPAECEVQDESYEDAYYDNGAAINGASDESGYDKAFSFEGEKHYDDKLVYNCNLSIETLDYDASVKSIKEKIKQAGGFVASENEYDNAYGWYYADYVDAHDRNINIEARIPSSGYESFLSSLEGNEKIVSRSSSVDNISRQYYDTEAVIESLKIQEDRLLTMLDEAVTIEDMVTVEARLTEVQTQLNQYQTSLSVMQADVDYSTVNINISEVYEYTLDVHTDTFFDRLGNTISESIKDFGEILENLLFFVILMIPRLLIFVPLIILVIFAIKKINANVKIHGMRKKEKLFKKEDGIKKNEEVKN